MPVSWLVEDVVTVTADPLATEQRRESETLRNHFLRNHHFVLRLWLSDDKFTNLEHELANVNFVGNRTVYGKKRT